MKAELTAVLSHETFLSTSTYSSDFLLLRPSQPALLTRFGRLLPSFPHPLPFFSYRLCSTLQQQQQKAPKEKAMADIEKQPTQTPAILPVEDASYDPLSESPSLGSDSGITKRNSREEKHAVAGATLSHELAEDDLEVSSTFSSPPSLLFSHLLARSFAHFQSRMAAN